MSPRALIGVAMASLGALMVLSAAFSQLPAVGASPGYVLAFVKLVVLAFVLKRVHDRNVYTMQWSSMFILLFMAEGLVRATSDPQPSAALGTLEAIVSVVFFVAVLAFLRPVKKAAVQAKKKDA